MARDLNHVVLIGRLVRDPEIRYTASGTPVVKFSIANNYSFLQQNERKEMVNFFDISVWGNQAVNCEKYLKKGSQVAVTGSLRQSTWVDQQSNQKRSKVEINASTVQFLSGGQGTGQPMSGGTGGFQQQQPQFSQPQANKPNYQQQPPVQQKPMNQGIPAADTNSPGFIQDPWAETGGGFSNDANSGGGDYYNDPYGSSPDNDDDIPF